MLGFADLCRMLWVLTKGCSEVLGFSGHPIASFEEGLQDWRSES